MGHANISVFVPHIGCPHQCSFCNQRSISGQQTAPTPQTVRATCEEAIRLRAGKLRDTELAFFGGSFTAIGRMRWTGKSCAFCSSTASLLSSSVCRA